MRTRSVVWASLAVLVVTAFVIGLALVAADVPRAPQEQSEGR